MDFEVVGRTYRLSLDEDDFSLLGRAFPSHVGYIPEDLKDVPGVTDVMLGTSILGPKHGGFLYLTIGARYDAPELHGQIAAMIQQNLSDRRIEAARLYGT